MELKGKVQQNDAYSHYIHEHSHLKMISLPMDKQKTETYKLKLH
jgi:hypothetical protein